MAWWDAARGASGASVSAWVDRVGGYSLAQGTASLQPVLTPGAVNGYPGVVSDGVDDYLEVSAVPAAFPTGTANGFICVLLDQRRAAATNLSGELFAYGGTTANSSRELLLRDSGAVNRLRLSDPLETLTDTVTDFTGVHFAEGRFSAGTTMEGWLDGTPTNPTSTTGTINTATTRVRTFASLNGTPATFALAAIAHIFVTTDLTTAERQQLEGWALWSVGKQALLPSTHPYRNRRP